MQKVLIYLKIKQLYKLFIKNHTIMTNKIKDKSKETIEHIKSDAKDYYKWKNMIFRYVILGFLFILLVLQFLLPNNSWITSQEDLNSDLEKTNLPEADQNTGFIQNDWYIFLDNDIAQSLIDVEKYIDYATTSITSNLSSLSILYKQNILFLTELSGKLVLNNIPADFQYLILLNWIEWPAWNLSQDIAENYGLIITDKVDERLNISKYTDITLEYLNDLYLDFKDRDLVLVAYLIWPDQLDSIIDNQKQDKFEDLYFEPYILDQYYKVLWYKAVFENILEYLDTKDIEPYSQAEISFVEIKETKSLIKRANKNDYTYKEIKQLNPWILWDALPKWDREIKVYSK